MENNKLISTHSLSLEELIQSEALNLKLQYLREKPIFVIITFCPLISVHEVAVVSISGLGSSFSSFTSTSPPPHLINIWPTLSNSGALRNLTGLSHVPSLSFSMDQEKSFFSSNAGTHGCSIKSTRTFWPFVYIYCANISSTLILCGLRGILGSWQFFLCLTAFQGHRYTIFLDLQVCYSKKKKFLFS